MSKLLWHAETGEPRVFGDDHEVPENYLDYHPADKAKAEAPKSDDSIVNKGGKSDSNKPKDNVLTRAEVAAALEAGGLAYDPRASVVVLTEQLVTSLKDFLGKAGVAFAEDESPRALLVKLEAIPAA